MRRILLIILVISLFSPQLVLAMTPSGTTTSNEATNSKNASRGAKLAQNSTDKLSKGIQRGDAEIDRRITALSSLLTKINSMKKISASSKASFSSQIQAEIDSLNSLKTKIDADTDLTTLKTDLQSIVKEYRVYLLYLPKMRILVAADRLGTAADNLTNYSATLSVKITQKEAEGQDVTSAKTQLTELNSKIADAKQMYQRAVDLVTPLSPTDWPNNKTTLQEAQSDIKEGAADLRTAFNDAVNIRKMLVGNSDLNNAASGSSKIKISPLK